MPLPDPQPAVLPTLTLTDTQALTALRAFLLTLVLPGTEVLLAQVNRVPEPAGADFIIMTPLLQRRLGTNTVTYFDNVFTGSITGSVLTVSAVAKPASPLSAGMLLTDTIWPTMSVAAGTVLGVQLTGTPGGIGTYAVSPAQTLVSETLLAGVRADLTEVELTVQTDYHGPASANNLRVVESLFRSEVGVDALAASGVDIAPLYCGDGRQAPFLNAEQMVENRWTMDLVMQVNPRVLTAQEFLTTIDISVIEVATEYTGPV